MDALIILFGFTILSWMFYKYSQEIKEIKLEIQLPYLTGQESSFEAKPVVEKQEVVKMPIEEKQIEEQIWIYLIQQ